MTRISILGATGSIGKSALELLRLDRARYEVVALTANSDAEGLARLAIEFRAKMAAVAEPRAFAALKAALRGSGIEAKAGENGIREAATAPSDILLAAISGAAGLVPTLAGLAPGRRIALANKECLVTAGSLFMAAAKDAGSVILPVDSEHNAVFQALACGRPSQVASVTLTASGGPFREASLERLARVTPEEALRHPNWSMGAKVSIDSATLMNKGLELIEAKHLFELRDEQLRVLVHPQSIVHALVEFVDGAVIAQLAPPDMRVPLAFCLSWPERTAWPAPRLDLAAAGSLTFEAPDLERFPALRLAMDAMRTGGAAPTVLNAANEVACTAFLERRTGFMGIPALVEAVMERADGTGLHAALASVEDALRVDHVARSIALDLLPQFAAKAS